MVSVVLPFLMSMMLGRTIDLRTYDIGGDIYDHADYTEVPLHVLNSTYNILEPNVFPYSHIGLPADLILRVKSNHLSLASGASGLDGLLKTSKKSRTTVIAFSTLFQTVYRELNHDAQLLPHWTDRILRSNTHYAASAIYGGWSTILYKVVCQHPEDDETVRKILEEKLGESGIMSEETVDIWNEAFNTIKNHPDLKDSINIEAERFSSHPLAEDVSTPDKLWDAIKKFETDVGLVGQPIFVEYKPLRKLDNRFPSVRASHLLDREMEVIDEMFDDLKFAQAAMRKWLKSTSVEFTKEQEKMMLKLFNHIRSTVDLFDSVAESASIYNEMDANLLKSAMLRYHKGLTKNTHSYKMLFHRLKEDLDGECEDTFRTGVRGILKVSHDERMELGELEDGVEECKRECIEEPKCRAIGYADHYPVLEYDESTRDFKIVRKEKQCWLYFRSSRTTTLIPAEPEAVTKIYDRYCY